jgi:flagellar hook-associated protein 1 FlgK
MGSTDLSIGLSGLLVSQRALQTIGHNIANANTPGYNRQVNILSARNPLDTPYGVIGQGVTITEIKRMKDDLVSNQILSYRSLLGDSEMQSEVLKHVEGIFNELSEYSLGNTIENFFGGIQELALVPELMSSRYQVLQDGINLANTFKYLDTQLKQLKYDNGEQIEAKVTELNTTTAQIADLNQRITAIVLSEGNASDLMDHRDVLLNRLSELADIRVTKNDNGTINVLLGGTLVVHGNNTEQLSTTATGWGTYRIDGIATINSGELKGLLNIQDVLLESYMNDLDTLAASIIEQINNIHSEGAGLDGGFTTLTSTNSVDSVTDQLSDTGLSFPPTINTYTTGSITNSTFTAGDGYSTVNASGTAFTSNVNVNDWVELSDGNHYRILSVVDDTTLIVEDEFASGAVATNDITDGSLYITITDDDTGEITKTSISITSDETLTTLQGKLDGITNLNASISGEVMSVSTDNGYTYNFTKTLDTDPGDISSSTVSLYGYYDGSDNDIYTLTVEDAGTGDIGTGSAVISVTDASGTVLANLDVGSSYTAGDVLQIADGISVSFGSGALTVSETLTFDVVSDPDTANVLTALGLNTFFKGSDASTIGVTEYIQDDVSRIGAASGDSQGDNTNALRLADVQNNTATEDSSFRDFLSGTVSELGIDAQTKAGEEESFSSVLLNLENRRQALSGVSIEEEMINIIRFQQAFQASARYVTTMSELGEILIHL